MQRRVGLLDADTSQNLVFLQSWDTIKLKHGAVHRKDRIILCSFILPSQFTVSYDEGMLDDAKRNRHDKTVLTPGECQQLALPIHSVIATAILSVRSSVCLSVTFWCFVQSNEDTIVRFSASGRKIILVSGEVKVIWIFARKALKWSTPSLAKIWPIIGHNLEMVQVRT